MAGNPGRLDQFERVMSECSGCHEHPGERPQCHEPACRGRGRHTVHGQDPQVGPYSPRGQGSWLHSQGRATGEELAQVGYVRGNRRPAQSALDQQVVGEPVEQKRDVVRRHRLQYLRHR